MEQKSRTKFLTWPGFEPRTSRLAILDYRAPPTDFDLIYSTYMCRPTLNTENLSGGFTLWVGVFALNLVVPCYSRRLLQQQSTHFGGLKA